MKTIVPFELSDSQRNHLAHMIDGRPSARMVTRKEITDCMEGCMAALLDETAPPLAAPAETPPAGKTEGTIDLFATHGDPHLVDKSPGFRRGWNQVKFSKQLRMATT